MFEHSNPHIWNILFYYLKTNLRTDHVNSYVKCRMIEEECSSVLEKLNYNIFDPESEINI